MNVERFPAQDTSAWSTVWPLLLTAALTLLVAFAVQFWVVPRVETRRRRDDRWDRDLLALGELLTFDQRGAANALGAELHRKAMFHHASDAPHADQPAELQELHQGKLDEVQAEYDRLDSRVKWLIERVESIDEYAEGLKPFVVAERNYNRYKMMQSDVGTVFHIWLAATRHYAVMEIEDLRNAERAAVESLVVEIKALAGHPPPRRSTRLRASRRVWQWIAAILRWRARRRVAGESHESR